MSGAITTRHAERFRSAVANCLGLNFDDSKLAFLTEVLRRRVEATRRAPDLYLAQLEGRSAAEEIEALAEELTVGETYFFRNCEQFRALIESAVPDLVRARAEIRQLRILSAGCASGEEAYSLAIAMIDASLEPSWNVSIRGVDINPVALSKAGRARFSSWALRETPPEVRDRWFTPENRLFALDEAVRASVRFEQRNLAHDDAQLWQPESYDVIFFRNVLMYFTAEQGQALVTRLERSLKPGGYLFLGHAETLRGVSNEFHLRQSHGTFYYQRKERSETRTPASLSAVTPKLTPVLIDAIEGGEPWIDAVRRATERIETLAALPKHAARTPRRSSDKPVWDLGAAVALLREERLSEALETVQQLPSESGRDPDVLLLRAALLTHRGQIAEAEASCRRLLEVDELNAGAHYLLALCREGASDPAGALQHDKVATYLDPSFAMPHFHMGLLARRAGDHATARTELGQALVLLQREDGPRVLLFGGGFSRETLVDICRTELVSCGGSA